MAKIEVVSRRAVFSASPARVGKQDRLIIYRVDGDPLATFFVTVPDETWSEALEEQEIRKAELDRKLPAPRTFNI